MVTTDELRWLARARIAVFGLFAAFGMVISTWAVHLPSLKQATGVSISMLGAIVLVLGIGALVGMQISGVLVDRFGSAPVGVLSVAAMAITMVPPLSVSTGFGAAVGAFFLGLSTGIAEVGINAAAVDVERGFGRPIMAAFHAVFSVGNVLGALIGAAGFSLGVSVFAAVLTVAVLALLVVAASSTVLLRQRPLRHDEVVGADGSVGESDEAPPRGRLVILGALAFLLLLAEGSAVDWSSLHAQQHLGVGSSAGAIALGSFVSAMTIGRFTVDRIAARFGPVWVVRWGALGAAVGLTIVMTSPWLALTLLGWAILGLGLSGGVPQVFTAAGNLAGGAGKALSRVVGTGYLAMLAGPALIGWLAGAFSLNAALLLPLAGVVVCAVVAGAVATRIRPPRG